MALGYGCGSTSCHCVIRLLGGPAGSAAMKGSATGSPAALVVSIETVPHEVPFHCAAWTSI